MKNDLSFISNVHITPQNARVVYTFDLFSSNSSDWLLERLNIFVLVSIKKLTSQSDSYRSQNNVHMFWVCAHLILWLHGRFHIRHCNYNFMNSTGESFSINFSLIFISRSNKYRSDTWIYTSSSRRTYATDWHTDPNAT